MGLAVAEQAAREMPVLQDEPVARFVRELGGHIVRRANGSDDRAPSVGRRGTCIARPSAVRSDASPPRCPSAACS
jgi:hypothetical protein